MRCKNPWAMVVLTLACNLSFAQTPTARILVGNPPGGAVDQLARLFAPEFGKEFGQTYIVETHPGANGRIATEMLKAAAPDGRTLMITPSSNLVIYPYTVKNPTYRMEDFVAVAIAGEYDTGLAVNPQSKAKDFKGFLELAKAQPDQANYATPGTGSLGHFFGMQLAQETGIPFKHVPYRGTGPAINDTMAGHVASVFSPVGTLSQQEKAGKLRLIAVTGDARSAQLPGVPTFRELGYPQLSSSAWFGFVAPAGTPPDTVARLNAVVARAMKDPSMLEKLKLLELQPHVVTPAEFAAKVKAESAQWAEVVKATGFSADAQ